MAHLETELVRHALSVARQHGFAEVELAIGDESFSARLEPLPKKSRASKAAFLACSPFTAKVPVRGVINPRLISFAEFLLSKTNNPTIITNTITKPKTIFIFLCVSGLTQSRIV
jgi:hypothetical protein